VAFRTLRPLRRQRHGEIRMFWYGKMIAPLLTILLHEFVIFGTKFFTNSPYIRISGISLLEEQQVLIEAHPLMKFYPLEM
jgi:hypothetical protein